MKDVVEVTFSVDSCRYEQYKNICRRNNIKPAIDLNRHIINVIKEDNKLYPGYRIVCCNLAGGRVAKIHEQYDESERKRLKEMAMICLDNNPDIIFAEDVSSNGMKTFTNLLKKNERKVHILSSKIGCDNLLIVKKRCKLILIRLVI